MNYSERQPKLHNSQKVLQTTTYNTLKILALLIFFLSLINCNTPISDPPPDHSKNVEVPPDLPPEPVVTLLVSSAGEELAYIHQKFLHEYLNALKKVQLDFIEILTFQEILDPKRNIPGSLSLGGTTRGILQNPATVPQNSKTFQILPTHRTKGTGYATEELIGLLQWGADEVNRQFPGSVMRTGNLSLRRGGKIKVSRSHQSGRDVDISFYVLNRAGKPIKTPQLITFDETGKSKPGGYQFDVPRNWALVEAFISYPGTQVQWLFVSQPLKDSLLAYARDKNTDPMIIEKASALLWQPTESSPHNDHFHMRIYCPEEDRLEGCLDRPPFWSWINFDDTRHMARALEVSKAFSLPVSSSLKQKAIEFLIAINGTEVSTSIVWRYLFEPDPKVRATMLEYFKVFRPQNGEWFLMFRIIETGSDSEIMAAFEVLKKMKDPESVQTLTTLFGDLRTISKGRRQIPVRLMALDVFKETQDTSIIPPLIDCLKDNHPKVRARAALILRRITNRQCKTRWNSKRLATKEQQKGVDDWTRWWDTHQGKKRASWVLEGYQNAGISINTISDITAVRPMLKALDNKKDYLAFNANYVLEKVTRHKRRRAWNQKARSKYWKKWWRRNKWRWKD